MAGGLKTGFESSAPKVSGGTNSGLSTGFEGSSVVPTTNVSPRGGSPFSAAMRKSGQVGGGGSGISGFFKNLGSDAEHAISGIPTGVVTIGSAIGHDIAHPWHPGHSQPPHLYSKVVAPIAKQYAHEYGPLFHGNFGKFGHEFYHHPLGPILDALTVATLGVGGVAKAGDIASRAGMISDTSRLANLGKAEDLTVPNTLNDKGEHITIRQTSRQPLAKLRQKAINAGLNKLPSETPGVGSTARAVRALKRVSAKEGSRLEVQAGDFNKAFRKLSKPEKIAWHLKARGLSPKLYQKIAEAGSPAHRLMDNPDVQAAFNNPSAGLLAALEHGRNLSEKLTNLRVAAGHLPEDVALHSPYRHLRDVTGGTTEDIMQALDKMGIPQPFHVEDSAGVLKNLRARYSSRASGYAHPPISGTKASQLILAKKGLINFTDNSLGRSFARYRNEAEAQLLHDELVKHAALLPKGEDIPRGWDVLPLNRGQAALPYTQRIASELEHELHPSSMGQRIKELGRPSQLQPRNHLGQIEEPHTLIVPRQVRKIVEDNSRTLPSKLGALRQHAFLSPWKAMVLGLRPAFFANVTIGNSILGALQMAPGHYGPLAWLNQVLPGLEHVAGSRLTEDLMKQHFPEQVTGTFGSDVSHGLHYYGGNKALRIASRAAQGVTPAMIRYENVLRRALAEGWLKSDPQFSRILERKGGDLGAALHEASPQLKDEVSRRVDDALGNYRTYNRFERAIKSIVPFYGWNRHVTRSLFRLVSERPQVLDALLQVGDQGRARADRLLGILPDYLNQSIPVHLPGYLGGQAGATTVLNPSAWNPLTTIADEGKMLAFPFTKAGGMSGAFPIAPDVQGFIEQLTGKNMFTGGNMKGNAFAQELNPVNLSPQLSAFLRKHPKPTAVNQNEWYAQVLRMLGLPVENLNLQQAHYNVAKYGPGG